MPQHPFKLIGIGKQVAGLPVLVGVQDQIGQQRRGPPGRQVAEGVQDRKHDVGEGE